MYRIMGAESLETTGFYDYPLDENVFAIEWSEHIADCLPEHTIRVTLQPISETTRQITIEGDERFAVLGN
jgi:tRNA threonylcarbamoyladenosine biosynthesis protein TsaE